MPALVNVIGNPARDPLAQQIVTDLGPLANTLTTKWQAMPMQRKINRFFIRQPQSWLTVPRIDLKNQFLAYCAAFNAGRKQLIEDMKREILAEYKLYMANVGRYVPSQRFASDRVMMTYLLRYINSRTGANGCRCEKPEPEPAPPRPKFGAVTSRLKCYDQTETGHDEVYLVCVAVDGNGKYVSTVSNKFSIDDDSDDLLFPRHWIYPMQDPNKFLDIAVRMIEDDGGYDSIAGAFRAVGGVVSAIGGAVGNPIAVGAGAALSLIGGVIDVIGDLDGDDDYGVQTKTWSSDSQLQSGVGSYLLSYTGEDWSGDNYDLDLSVRLDTAA